MNCRAWRYKSTPPSRDSCNGSTVRDSRLTSLGWSRVGSWGTSMGSSSSPNDPSHKADGPGPSQSTPWYARSSVYVHENVKVKRNEIRNGYAKWKFAKNYTYKNKVKGPGPTDRKKQWQTKPFLWLTCRTHGYPKGLSFLMLWMNN